MNHLNRKRFRLFYIFNRCALGLLLATNIAAASVAAEKAVALVADKHFVAARTAFHKSDAQALQRSIVALEGHVLLPWAQYWRLRLQLDDKNAKDEIGLTKFLAAHSGSYLADRLRNDWLRKLGETGSWETFSRELPLLAATTQRELDIDCYAAQVANTPEQIRPAWLAGQELPVACDNVVRQLVVAGGLTVEEVWQRLRRRMEAKRLGLAKDAAYLPDSEDFDGKGLEAISQRPEPWLNKFMASVDSMSTARGNRERAIFALQRLAQTDPHKAAQTFEQIEQRTSRFSDEERAYGWGQIALAAALKHQPEALGWFQKSNALATIVMTDFQLAWHARAALRASNWSGLRQVIARMPGELVNSPDWTYWQGRALMTNGESAEASKLFQRIAGQPNFYGILANEELGRPMTLPPQAPAPTRVDIAAASVRPGLQRALALFRLDMRTEGLKEWSWAMRGLNDRELLAAAELARGEGVLDRAIHAADRTISVHDYSLRYLAPFRDHIEPATQRLDLDSAWVYGLMRQESRFVPAAKSSVGAQGLMQVMPATAKWVARKIGLTDFHPKRTNELATNIELGTNYLKIVLGTLDNHPVLASAAYNAGPGRARRWRDDQPMEGAIYAETIPFTETRDYVKKVMSNAVIYSALFNQPAVPLKVRLGTINPRGQSEPSLADVP
jgi:soluble lytic murein transglycosylase